MATLDDLVAALDADQSETTTTSVRQPVALREALRIAVELGMASSANEASGQALRDALQIFAANLALDEHFAAHPETRPPLHKEAQALAVMDRSPVADREDLLLRAAEEVVKYRPEAHADDVLLWATALLEQERASGRRAS